MNAAHLVERAEQAANADKLTPEAFENLKRWLEGEAYSAFWPEMETWIDEGQYERINDSFGAVLPFGTGGRRGRVGIGPNRINARTIGESAQGVANYVLKNWKGDQPPSVAIASDTRTTSPEFTQLTAEVFVGNGLRVFLFDGPRATPELSFAVRYLKAERFYLYTIYTFGDQRPDPFSDAEAYRILSAASGTNLLPAFDPYADFLEATIVEDLRQNIVTGAFDMPASGEEKEIWAAFYFSPAANDPDVNGKRADLSKLNPEGGFSRGLDLAEAARWARSNAQTLRDTHWIGGDPAKLEIYGWASWSPSKGILVLRNPSDKAQDIEIDVKRAFELPTGAPTTYQLSNPFRAARFDRLEFSARNPRTITLLPFEVVVLESRSE